MSTKLYVGNLSYEASEAGLTEDFGKAGPVKSVKIIMDQMTGRSRGFAFVEMDSPEATQEAIQMFDGKELYGRALKVNLAKERSERPERSAGGGGARGGFGGNGPRRDGNRSGGNDWGGGNGNRSGGNRDRF